MTTSSSIRCEDEVQQLPVQFVRTTVRETSGTATESRLLPVTVTTVPPLKIHTKYIQRKYFIGLTSKLRFRNDFALSNPGIVVYS